MSDDRRNWAGNYAYRAVRIHWPQTLAEVQALVAGSRQIRALGSRHSFNAVADSPGELISLERLAPALAQVAGALDVLNALRETPRGTLR